MRTQDWLQALTLAVDSETGEYLTTTITTESSSEDSSDSSSDKAAAKAIKKVLLPCPDSIDKATRTGMCMCMNADR